MPFPYLDRGEERRTLYESARSRVSRRRKNVTDQQLAARYWTALLCVYLENRSVRAQK